MIVDERFNGGGLLADHIVDYLRQPIRNYASTREGHDQQFPTSAIPGPKVMLINEMAGSGGDYLPYTFRQSGLGPLVGKRTWGGLVGIGGYPPLIDGGSVTAPRWGIWFPNGRWDVENRGVHRTSKSSSIPSSSARGRSAARQGDRDRDRRAGQAPRHTSASSGIPQLLQTGNEGAGRREVNVGRNAASARERDSTTRGPETHWGDWPSYFFCGSIEGRRNGSICYVLSLLLGRRQHGVVVRVFADVFDVLHVLQLPPPSTTKIARARQRSSGPP